MPVQATHTAIAQYRLTTQKIHEEHTRVVKIDEDEIQDKQHDYIRLRKIKDESAQKDTQLQILRKELQELQRFRELHHEEAMKIEMLEKMVQEKDTELREHRTRNSSLTQNMADANVKIMKLEDQHRVSHSVITEQTERLSLLESERESSRTFWEESQRELLKEFSALQSQLQQCRDRENLARNGTHELHQQLSKKDALLTQSEESRNAITSQKQEIEMESREKDRRLELQRQYLSDMERKSTDLADTIARLKEENEVLQDQLITFRSQCAQTAKLSAELKACQYTCEELQQKRERLEYDLQSTKEECSRVKDETKRAIADHTHEAEVLNAEISKLRGSLERVNSELRDAQAEAKARSSAFSSEIQDLKLELQKGKAHIDKLNSELNASHEETQRAKDELQKRSTDHAKEVAEHQSEASKSKAAADKLQSELRSHQEEIFKLQMEVKHLNLEVTNLKQKNSERVDSIATSALRMTEHLQKIESDRDAEKTKLANGNSLTFDTAKYIIDDCSLSLFNVAEQWKNKATSLRENTRILEQQIKELQQQVHSIHEQHRVYQSEMEMQREVFFEKQRIEIVSNHTRVYEDMKMEIETLASKNNFVSLQLNEVQMQFSHKSQEFDALFAENEGTKRNLMRFGMELEACSEENRDLKRITSVLKEDITRVREEKMKFEIEFSEATRIIKQFDEQAFFLNGKLEDLSRQKQFAEEKLQHTLSELTSQQLLNSELSKRSAADKQRLEELQIQLIQESETHELLSGKTQALSVAEKKYAQSSFAIKLLVRALLSSLKSIQRLRAARQFVSAHAASLYNALSAVLTEVSVLRSAVQSSGRELPDLHSVVYYLRPPTLRSVATAALACIRLRRITSRYNPPSRGQGSIFFANQRLSLSPASLLKNDASLPHDLPFEPARPSSPVAVVNDTSAVELEMLHQLVSSFISCDSILAPQSYGVTQLHSYRPTPCIAAGLLFDSISLDSSFNVLTHLRSSPRLRSAAIPTRVRSIISAVLQKITHSEKTSVSFQLAQQQALEEKAKLQQILAEAGASASRREIENSEIIKSQSATVDSLNNKVHILEYEREFMVSKEKFESVTQELQVYSHKISLVAQENEMLKAQLQVLSAEIQDLRNSARRYDDQRAKDSLSIEERDWKIGKLQSDLSHMHSHVNESVREMTEIRREKEREVEMLIISSTNHKNDIQRLQSILSQLQHECDSLKRAVNSSEQRAQEEGARAGKAELKLKRKDIQLATTQELVERLTKANDQLTRELQTSQKELLETRSVHQTTMAEHQRLAKQRVLVAERRARAEQELHSLICEMEPFHLSADYSAPQISPISYEPRAVNDY